MNQVLNHNRIVAPDSEPQRWLYLLHGIYGSGRNWGSLARRLTEIRPEWGVILVDLRLHGDSTDFEPPHTVDTCAADVIRLEESLRLPADALIGHSFGGKVGLVRAGTGDPLQQVWIADSTLRTGEPEGTAWNVVEIVAGLPETFASRTELADAMVEAGYERGVGQWLGVNLERQGDEFRWTLDWDGVEQMLRDYFRTDVWSVVEDPPEGTAVHFIKASKSGSIDEETVARIGAAASRTGQVLLHTVQAGHWLNVDNPEAVLDLLAEHLPS